MGLLLKTGDSRTVFFAFENFEGRAEWDACNSFTLYGHEGMTVGRQRAMEMMGYQLETVQENAEYSN